MRNIITRLAENTVKAQSCTWEAVSNKHRKMINICHLTVHPHKAEIFFKMTILAQVLTYVGWGKYEFGKE